MSLGVEALDDIQKALDTGEAPQVGQCEALLAEIWRLKTVLTARSIERQAARDEVLQLEGQLRAVVEQNEVLRRELEQLKALHGLPVCELEGRWSNCAVRMKKCEFNPE